MHEEDLRYWHSYQHDRPKDILKPKQRSINPCISQQKASNHYLRQVPEIAASKERTVRRLFHGAELPESPAKQLNRTTASRLFVGRSERRYWCKQLLLGWSIQSQNVEGATARDRGADWQLRECLQTDPLILGWGKGILQPIYPVEAAVYKDKLGDRRNEDKGDLRPDEVVSCSCGKVEELALGG